MNSGSASSDTLAMPSYISVSTTTERIGVPEKKTNTSTDTASANAIGTPISMNATNGSSR